jgi:hypothetical protein
MMELHLTTVEERKYVKPEEAEEIIETDTDSTVRRPRLAFDAHKNTHTPTTSLSEEHFQHSANAEQSPTTRKVAPVESSSIFKPRPHSPSSSNLAKLSSIQDQEDQPEELAPQHMEKVHKDDSSSQRCT